MRHLVAIGCFAALCASGATLFDGGVGYALACAFLLLPLGALWLFVVSRWDARAAAAREPPAVGPLDPFALPRGVEWEFPDHQPGDCGGPEVPDGEGVED